MAGQAARPLTMCILLDQLPPDKEFCEHYKARRRPPGARVRLRDDLTEWFLCHVGGRFGELYGDSACTCCPAV